MINKNTIIRTTGNLLIIFSILGFIITYAPLWPYYFAKNIRQEQSDFLQNSNEEGIWIPKIGAQAVIIYNVNPWNQAEYGKALEKGVAQAKGTSIPGESGTTYIFAHSSLAPWQMTRTNTPFLFLNELTINDEINIRREGVLYRYLVTGAKEIWPTETKYLTEKQAGTDLILQTCTPIGTSIKRLLVFAKLAN